MSGWRRFLAAGVGALSVLVLGASSVAADEGGSLIEFHSMTPITGATVGATNDRGLKAGGLPWAITLGIGEVNRNGLVEVKVKGLVLAAGPAAGTNPIGTFGAVVSCITPSGVVNVTTTGFPASTAGDSRIHDVVTLPSDCSQPEVFVGALLPGGVFRFFAVSNANQGDDD